MTHGLPLRLISALALLITPQGAHWAGAQAIRALSNERGISVSARKVYLDNAHMNPGSPNPPFDINSLAPSQIEAIEYYNSPAEVPMKYSMYNASCGIIIVHSRQK